MSPALHRISSALATLALWLSAIGLVGMAIDVMLRQGEAWLRRRRGLQA